MTLFRSHSLHWAKRLLVLLVLLTYAGSAAAQNEEEWVDLFNGSNLDNWIVKIYHHEVGVNFGDTFRVEDGLIKVRYDGYGDFNEQFGHLYYQQPFSYFRLVFEYRFVGNLHPGAPDFADRNSGVMFHSQDPRTMPKEQNWPISVEMQLLAGLDDGNPRPTGSMCSPGTNVVFDGQLDTRHCINSSAPTLALDEWVQGELVVLGDSLVTHIINGETVLQYAGPQIGGNVVEGYDPAIKQDGKMLTEGFIALQSEGQPIDFRNVRLLNLKGCMEPGNANYRSYYVASDPAACQ